MTKLHFYCLDDALGGHSTENENLDSNTILLIVGGVGALVVVCLIGLGVFVLKNRKFKTRRKVQEKIPEGRCLSISINMRALKM